MSKTANHPHTVTYWVFHALSTPLVWNKYEYLIQPINRFRGPYERNRKEHQTPKALEEIRELKHRYLNACDAKEVEVIRQCFAPGEILIDFGPLGSFTDRDSFIALYEELACHPRVRDLHHSSNPEIELISENEASARWALYYFNQDGESGAALQLTGQYKDRYRQINGQWLIVETVFQRFSLVEYKTTPASLQ